LHPWKSLAIVFHQYCRGHRQTRRFGR
jgi:hypothetical protein